MELDVSTRMILKEDNKACINHRNSNHIDYRHHFVREGVQRGDISKDYIEKTQFQIVDIFTKALDAVTSIKLRDILVVSVSILNLNAKNSEESVEKKSDEPVEKKQKK